MTETKHFFYLGYWLLLVALGMIFVMAGCTQKEDSLVKNFDVSKCYDDCVGGWHIGRTFEICLDSCKYQEEKHQNYECSKKGLNSKCYITRLHSIHYGETLGETYIDSYDLIKCGDIEWSCIPQFCGGDEDNLIFLNGRQYVCLDAPEEFYKIANQD